MASKNLSYPIQEFECFAIHLARRCHELCGFASKYHKGSVRSSGVNCGMWWIFHSRTEEHEKLIKTYNIDMGDYNRIRLR